MPKMPRMPKMSLDGIGINDIFDISQKRILKSK
jgi:hypothetical protein